jgi:FixJ family two-component response regulator
MRFYVYRRHGRKPSVVRQSGEPLKEQVNKSAHLIFIIEDDGDVRASTRIFLEAEGYRVREFADSEAFLAATEGREADCIVTDLHLPGRSGVELIALLRGRGVTTPAIIVSADSREAAKWASELGLAAVLGKPLAAEALAACLTRLFSASQD